MKLYVKDRIILMQVIPTNLELTFAEFMAKKDFMRKLAISDEEKEHFGIKTEDGAVKWDIEKDIAEPLDVEVSDTMASVLRMIIEGESDKKHDDNVWDTLARVYDAVSQKKAD